MPAIVLWIGGMLVSVVGQMAVTALLALGIGFGTTKAVEALGFGDAVRDMLGRAGPLYDYVGFFGIDVAMTIVLSAWAGRMATDAAKAYVVSMRARH